MEDYGFLDKAKPFVRRGRNAADLVIPRWPSCQRISPYGVLGLFYLVTTRNRNLDKGKSWQFTKEMGKLWHR